MNTVNEIKQKVTKKRNILKLHDDKMLKQRQRYTSTDTAEML